MRHTLKWSFFIGTAAAGIVLALMKLFQPIRYEHLVLFGYAFVGTSVIAGYVVHKNLEKRNMNKAQIVKTDGGKMEARDIAVRRIPIGGSGAGYMQEKNAEEKTEKPAEASIAERNSAGVPDFVPASTLLRNQQNPDNREISGNENAGSPENKESAAESFLDEIEKEEVENEMRKTANITTDNYSQPKSAPEENNAAASCEKTDSALQKDFRECRGKPAKVFTKDGGTICGKFAGLDTHAALEDAQCGSERKSLILVSKSEIARMEVE